jgi:hypothetical protein
MGSPTSILLSHVKSGIAKKVRLQYAYDLTGGLGEEKGLLGVARGPGRRERARQPWALVEPA